MTEYYVSPDGDDSNPGTEAAPLASLQPVAMNGAQEAGPGDTVYVRAGTYYPREKARFARVSGTADAPLTITRYPGDDRPTFDFSRTPDWEGLPSSNRLAKGVIFVAKSSHVVVEGLEFRNCPGMALHSDKSDHITFRDNVAHETGNAAFKFYSVDDGLMEDNLAYDNAGGGDSLALGSADAFAITGKKGSTDRVSERCTFRRNVGHHCSDDGVDLFTSRNCVVHDNVMYANGFAPDGELWSVTVGGDASDGPQSKGIKLGGGTDIAPRTGGHVVYNNLSFHNKGTGVGWNGAEIPIQAYNNTSLENGLEGFETYNSDAIGRQDEHELYNNVAMGNGWLHDRVAPNKNWGDYNPKGDEVTHADNSWNVGYGTFDLDADASTSPSDPARGEFVTLARDDGYAPEEMDAFATPTSDSPFVDAGRSLGSSYPSSSTDMGAFPYDGSTVTEPSPTGASLKVYDGGGFVAPTAVRVYDGGQWVPSALRVATGDGFAEAFAATDATLQKGDVLDDFERSAPLDDYRGATDAFAVVTDTVYRESAAVEYVATGDDRLILRDSPDPTVVRGSEYRVQVYPHDTGTYGKFYFLASGTGHADVDGYAVEYDAAPNVTPGLKLLRFDGGEQTVLAEAPFDPVVGEWLTVDLFTSADRLAASVLRADGTRLGSVRTLDATYDAGTYGFGSNNPRVTFDALKKL
jgi:hypothetical protein